MKKSIPYSQFLRLRRLCSNENDYVRKAAAMSSFFTDRGYPATLIEQALNRAQSIPRSQALNSKDAGTTDVEDRCVVTLTYHPHNHPVRDILRRNFSILQDDPKLKVTFRQAPLVAFKRDKNLADHLIRSAFQPTRSTLPPGNSKCTKPNCKTCTFINPAIEVQGPSGRKFFIRSHFSCQTPNVVYLLSCSLCHAMYVGETYRTLNERFREHRDNILTKKDTPVGHHFNTGHHTLSHVSIAVLWHNGRGDGLYRKFMESRIISRLGTLQPQGLNIRE